MSRHPAGTDLPPENSLLFVYGTLQRGGQYHYFLEQCRADFVCTGILTTPYPLILAQYPCLLDQPGRGFRVHGEVYRLARPIDWLAIDRLEAHPIEYTRRLEPVEAETGILQAWTYFYNFPGQLDPKLKPVPRFSPEPGVS
jgi:gamma-glutamylcyclotransferase (GGCT)/AIG2-like uncharacterized protein YtfP